MAKSNPENAVWVEDTLNDMIAWFAIGTPPIENAREDVSPMAKGEPVQDDPARVSSLGTRGKEPIAEPSSILDPLGTSSSAMPRDGPECKLM